MDMGSLISLVFLVVVFGALYLFLRRSSGQLNNSMDKMDVAMDLHRKQLEVQIEGNKLLTEIRDSLNKKG